MSGLEIMLREVSGTLNREQARICSLAAMEGQSGEQTEQKVLQTYTVPLAKVREELPLWKDAMMDECRQLKAHPLLHRPVPSVPEKPGMTR